MKAASHCSHRNSKTQKVVDYEVRVIPGSVSLFSPGSFQEATTLGNLCRNDLFVLVTGCGWATKEHGAKGLCRKEPMCVRSGSRKLPDRRNIVRGSRIPTGEQPTPVIPNRAETEPQFVLGVLSTKSLKWIQSRPLLKLPWFDS